MSKRPTWDEYFIELARLASSRSTCNRKKVGCVVVRENRVLSTGYNGSLSGLPHCDDVGHLMVDNHCQRTVHAEANAVANAAKAGISLEGSTLYCNTFPCWRCFQLLASAGIKKINYWSSYRLDPLVTETAKEIEIEISRISIKTHEGKQWQRKQ